MKPGETGIKRVLHATGYSIKGLKSAWKYEAAFRQETVLLILLSILTIYLPIENSECIPLISSLFIIAIVELLNSAIEVVVDRVGDEWNELSGRAKDIASAAVFLSILHAIYVWGSTLFNLQ